MINLASNYDVTSGHARDIEEQVHATKIILQYLARTAVARDWRVVMIPEGDVSVTLADLYQCIVDHALDTLEPFVLLPEQKNVPIKAQIGKEQAGAFQDIPMAVSISDAVPTFGVYIKFFVQCEEVQGACARVSVACRMKNII